MERIIVATATGSSHDTVEELVGLFDEALAIPVEIKTCYTLTQAQETDFNRLILLGGTDISPKLYGEINSHSTGISETRDAIEVALMQRAMAAGIPTMGICRGHQMIAAMHGGTLWQDFGKQLGTNHGWTHRLKDVAEPLASKLPTHTVNSLHHQSVRDVPPGFSVLARAHDGIIESIGMPGVLGVQFHPEMHIETNPDWADLFAWWILDGLSWN